MWKLRLRSLYLTAYWYQSFIVIVVTITIIIIVVVVVVIIIIIIIKILTHKSVQNVSSITCCNLKQIFFSAVLNICSKTGLFWRFKYILILALCPCDIDHRQMFRVLVLIMNILMISTNGNKRVVTNFVDLIQGALCLTFTLFGTADCPDCAVLRILTCNFLNWKRTSLEI